MSALSKINSRASLDRSPKVNHVERVGGLPMYIRRIANHLHQEKGMTIGHAIATAKNAAAKMCATGDLNFPGAQQVNPASKAEACAAVADWNLRIAKTRVAKGILGRKMTDNEYIEFLVNEMEIHKSMDCDCEKEGRRKKKKKVSKRDFSAAQRRKSAKKGHALPDGSFPIENKEDLKNAKKLLGHAKNKKKAAALISRREKELKKSMNDKEFDETVAKFFDPDTDDDTVNFEAVAEIEKRDDEKQLVFGWCSIAKHADGTVEVDKQGDVLEDIEQMEAVAYDFVLNSRDGGEMHVRKGVSTLVESFFSTPEKWEAMGIPENTLPIGWWVGFKVHDQEVWKGVKSGKYKMFSVHGSGTRKALD